MTDTTDVPPVGRGTAGSSRSTSQVEMQRSLPRLRDERHRRPRAARRARRAQAGAPPGALRDVRRRLPARPRLLQVRPRRRRRHGQVPPARRHRDLRHPGAARRSRGRCATRWSTARATSARRATTRAAAMRYTECRLAPLAMEMLRDIDEETVDFAAELRRPHAGADGPAGRFPNLLVNGSGGIAVGMATNIPPHNLREVAAGVQWYLDNPEAHRRGAARGAARARSRARTSRPAALIVGTHGHRGRVPHRPRLDHDARRRRGRGGQPAAAPCLVVTELPYQVNPDNLALQDRRAGQRRQGRRHRRRPRRARRRAPASAWSSCSSATPSPRSC